MISQKTKYAIKALMTLGDELAGSALRSGVAGRGGDGAVGPHRRVIERHGPVTGHVVGRRPVGERVGGPERAVADGDRGDQGEDGEEGGGNGRSPTSEVAAVTHRWGRPGV